MHVGHLILVKAESHEEAIGKVADSLITESGENSIADWSDWHAVADRGFSDSRWNFADEVEGEWDGASRYAVSLEDEADLFYAMVNKFYGYREAAHARAEQKVQEYGLSYKLDQDDQNSWSLYRYAQLTEGIYCPDSFVYDLENYTPNLKWFRENSAENADWYAVLVDFHF